MCHVCVAMCCFGVYMDVRICYVMLYAMVIMCMFYNVADCYMCYLPMRIILYHGVLCAVRNSAPVLAVRNELLVSVGKLHADEAEALHERPPRKTKRSRGEGPLAIHEANCTLCTPARTAHNIFRRRARARAARSFRAPSPPPPPRPFVQPKRHVPQVQDLVIQRRIASGHGAARRGKGGASGQARTRPSRRSWEPASFGGEVCETTNISACTFI